MKDIKSWLEHLQSATRAFKNGESGEMVAATLLHDIGDELVQWITLIIRINIKTLCIWKHIGSLKNMVCFKLLFSEHLGGDKNARERYKDHKYYQATVDFCENYDNVLLIQITSQWH